MGIFSKLFGGKVKSPEPEIEGRKTEKAASNPKRKRKTKRKDHLQKTFTLSVDARTLERREEMRESLNFIRDARPEYASQGDALHAVLIWAKASLERNLEAQKDRAKAQTPAQKVMKQSAALPKLPTLNTMDPDELAKRICICEDVLSDASLAYALQRKWAMQSGALTRLRQIAIEGVGDQFEWRNKLMYTPALDAYYSPVKGAMRPKGNSSWHPIDAKVLAEKIKGAC